MAIASRITGFVQRYYVSITFFILLASLAAGCLMIYRDLNSQMSSAVGKPAEVDFSNPASETLRIEVARGGDVYTVDVAIETSLHSQAADPEMQDIAGTIEVRDASGATVATTPIQPLASSTNLRYNTLGSLTVPGSGSYEMRVNVTQGAHQLSGATQRLHTYRRLPPNLYAVTHSFGRITVLMFALACIPLGVIAIKMRNRAKASEG